MRDYEKSLAPLGSSLSALSTIIDGGLDVFGSFHMKALSHQDVRLEKFVLREARPQPAPRFGLAAALLALLAAVGFVLALALL